ncbi:MAG: DUF427 domain-containing protein [Chitinophagaceae bacterium]|jgi:uncharacterized protein (DUF427 family)|nr:DUF427 domain-containing protein [Chitinophagaceae bacterium]
MKAIFNNQIIAESDETISFEGSTYFPKSSIIQEYFKPSRISSICDEKGVAHYYTIEVKGESRDEAAWCYPEVSDYAKKIENYVAFWKGIRITRDM